MNTKYIFLLVIIILTNYHLLSAQGADYAVGKSYKYSRNPLFKKGTQLITLGYGFPNWGAIVLQNTGGGRGGAPAASSNIGPIHARYDYGLTDNFSIGASFVYSDASVSRSLRGRGGATGRTSTTDNRSISAMGRFNIHFHVTDIIDPYWGLGIGYKNTQISTTPANGRGGGFNLPVLPVAFETTVGIRFHVIDKFGAYIESGIARSFINGGVTYNLNPTTVQKH